MNNLRDELEELFNVSPEFLSEALGGFNGELDKFEDVYDVQETVVFKVARLICPIVHEHFTENNNEGLNVVLGTIEPLELARNKGLLNEYTESIENEIAQLIHPRPNLYKKYNGKLGQALLTMRDHLSGYLSPNDIKHQIELSFGELIFLSRVEECSNILNSALNDCIDYEISDESTLDGMDIHKLVDTATLLVLIGFKLKDAINRIPLDSTIAQCSTNIQLDTALNSANDLLKTIGTEVSGLTESFKGVGLTLGGNRIREFNSSYMSKGRYSKWFH